MLEIESRFSNRLSMCSSVDPRPSPHIPCAMTVDNCSGPSVLLKKWSQTTCGQKLGTEVQSVKNAMSTISALGRLMQEDFCEFEADLDYIGKPCIKANKERAGELAHWLRVLNALPKDLGSIPSTHIAAHNLL
ncbi:hypothetical protein I79_012807 [Cricetulus griseus]|uniref:Uncharacterized protein n=1 Tax=Cricetulus griseus TaxID=10029 RepID=G3HPT7_CRIGR|nr:hypothetical protein I79_012807 [Cricetulus griseus]